MEPIFTEYNGYFLNVIRLCHFICIYTVFININIIYKYQFILNYSISSNIYFTVLFSFISIISFK